MRPARPTIAEERRLALRDGISSRSPGVVTPEERDRALETLTTTWRYPTTTVRVAFFILGAIAISMASGLGGSWIVGLLAIGVAEYLIASKRIVRHGVEEALWIFGVLIITTRFYVVDTGLAILLMVAAGLFLAGVRLLNEYLAALALIPFFFWIAWQLDELVVLVPTGSAIALLATWLARFEWKRPFVSRALGLSTIVSFGAASFGSSENLWEGVSSLWPSIAMIVVAIPLCWMAVQQRNRYPLIAVILFGWLPASTIAARVGLPRELKFLLAGITLFAFGLGLEKYLRSAPRGITSIRIDRSRDMELIDLAAMATAGHHAGDVDQGAVEEEINGGGDFGGAGATDDW